MLVMNHCTITAILRDGSHISANINGRMVERVATGVLRLYRDGIIAGYVLTPRKPDLTFIPLDNLK